MSADVMQAIEARNTTKKDVPKIEIGDTVDVEVWIKEGDKPRTQRFTGTVIAMKHGGLRETFTVRRIVDGEGVERTFPLHSPNVESVKVTRHGVVRRAKLYFLRDRVGKATRLKERQAKHKIEEGTTKKKKGKKRGAKAKAERRARAEAEGKTKGKAKGKKKAAAKS